MALAIPLPHSPPTIHGYVGIQSSFKHMVTPLNYPPMHTTIHDFVHVIVLA